MYENLFFERLAQLRTLKNVSAREMSLSLGQSEGYINNIENRNNLPSMSVFFYICEYLKVSPKNFFDFDSTNPVKLDEMIKDLKGLSNSQLSLIHSLIKEIKK